GLCRAATGGAAPGGRPSVSPRVVSATPVSAAADEAHRTIAPVVGPDDERVFTDSGIEIKPLYTEEDVAPGLEERLGQPGEPPFTRGIHERMYRDRLGTMRHDAGCANPGDPNRRDPCPIPRST